MGTTATALGPTGPAHQPGPHGGAAIGWVTAAVPVLVGTACAAGTAMASTAYLPADAPSLQVAIQDAARGLSPRRLGASLAVALALRAGLALAGLPGRRGHAAAWLVSAALMAAGLVWAVGRGLAGGSATLMPRPGAPQHGWLLAGALGALAAAVAGATGPGPRRVSHVPGPVLLCGLVVPLGAAYVQTGHLVSGRRQPIPNGGDWVAGYPWLTLAAATTVAATVLAVALAEPAERGDPHARLLLPALLVFPFTVPPVLALGGRPGALAAFAAAPLVLWCARSVRRNDFLIRRVAWYQATFGILLATGLFLSAPA